MRICIYLLLAILLSACTTKPLPLAEYEGLYEYENETTLIIIAGPKRELLYASISGSRYPLRPARPDVFLNSGDVEIEFVRDKQGQIMGYRENNGDSSNENSVYALLDRNQTLPSSSWVAKPDDRQLPYTYIPPSNLNDGIPVEALSADDPLARQMTAMTNAIYADVYPYTQSVLLVRDGALVFEEYFYEFDRDKPHQLRSGTKTLMAILTGIAIDEGLIASIKEPVLPYFDDYVGLENLDADKLAITIEDLLTMQSGLDCNDWDGDSPGNESKMVYAEDWVKFILDLSMATAPGTTGSYCSGNVVLMGRIIEKASGIPLKIFADEHLFTPLGITDHEWDFRPDRSNINNFVQAWMTPRDMMKIGLLLDQRGEWENVSIVSGAWVDQLTGAQSQIGNTPYGFFFWRRFITPDGNRRYEIPQMSGNGGQKVILLKEQNAVLVLTGGNYNQSSHTNNLLADFILKGLD